MVQILREQTRNYAADQSGAIRQQQLAKNIGEWGDVIQTTRDIAIKAAKQTIKDRETRDKLQEKAQEKQIKLQQEADEKIIKTQIGQKASILAQNAIQREIESGRLNPNTTSGQKRIEDIAAEHYASYYRQGQTEKFDTDIATMQRKTADEGLKKAFNLYESYQKKQASDSMDYISLYNSKMAEEAGRAGDFDSYMSFTEKTTDPVVNYMVTHGSDKDKETAAAKWRLRQGTSYLIGMAQDKPVEAARIIGIQDRQAVEDLLKEQNPKMSKKEVKALTDSIMESESKVADEQLEKIFGDKVLNSYGEDEVMARKNLRDDLQKALGRMVRKGMAQQELQAKKDNYDAVSTVYSNVLSPDPIVAADASLSVETGVSGLSEDFMNEVPNIKESLSLYQENSSSIKEDMFPTMEGTIESLKQIQAFALSDKQKPAEKIELALNTANSIHEEPVTQQQYEEANSIMYNALSDEDYQKQLEYSMAMLSATVLDNYADLFPDFEDIKRLEQETDSEFRKYSEIGINSGIEKDVEIETGGGQITLNYGEDVPKNLYVKTKAKSFDWDKTDFKSKLKYNLLRDTYGAVQTALEAKNFDEANKKIFELPYHIATINYREKLSPDLIYQFMAIDSEGKQSVYPQFEYDGYTFQYMGIDRKTGIIKAKRIL